MNTNYTNKKNVKRTVKESTRGFTLIETLVAISILLLSIIGPMEIAARGLFSAYYARDEITAYYLAQEGIEYIRNVRDTKYLDDFNAGNAFSESLEGKWIRADAILSCIATGGNPDACLIDVLENNVTACKENNGNNSCTRSDRSLRYDKDTYEYSYRPETDSNQPSKFFRTIKITLHPNQEGDQEALVSSKVVWRTGSLLGTMRTFEIKERLINWQR